MVFFLRARLRCKSMKRSASQLICIWRRAWDSSDFVCFFVMVFFFGGPLRTGFVVMIVRFLLGLGFGWFFLRKRLMVFSLSILFRPRMSKVQTTDHIGAPITTTGKLVHRYLLRYTLLLIYGSLWCSLKTLSIRFYYLLACGTVWICGNIEKSWRRWWCCWRLNGLRIANAYELRAHTHKHTTHSP